jgi:uncharacterized repeat protein (TIGR01451 family)
MIHILQQRSFRQRTVRRSSIGLAILLLLIQPWSAGGLSGSRSTFAAQASAGFDRLPLSFVPNQGQSHPAVRYQAHALGGSVLFFTQDGVVLALPPDPPAGGKPLTGRELRLDETAPAEPATPAPVLRLSFLGANPAAEIVGDARLPGTVSYFLGSDPEQWHTSLPTYAKITYQDLYPGISLVYEGSSAGSALLKGTYIVAPGADPGLIRWRYEGAAGLSLDEAGNLHIAYTARPAPGENANNPSGGQIEAEVLEQAPIVWQGSGEERVTVPAQYALAADGSIGFTFPEGYDRSQALILDPTLTYSSYLGGDGEDVGYSIATDATGIYVVGYTFSTNFPLDGAIDPDCGTDAFCNGGYADVFITKLNPAGSDTLYSTYLGGSGNDYGVTMALDSANNAYVTGLARADFPTTSNAYQQVYGSAAGVGADGFLTKLNPTGSALLYSTYLGGDNGDGAWGLAVNASNGEAFLNGQTLSTNFPTTAGAYDTGCGTDGACNYDGSTGYSDAFIVQLSTTISGTASLLYSTYLGGSSDDQGFGIARDGPGNLYVTGRTLSTDLPTPGTPYQGSNLGYYDAYVARLDPSQSGAAGLVYGTYLGGINYDDGYGISVDDSNEVYLVGTTGSPAFPLENPIQGVFGGGPYDAYVAKLEADGSDLSYSTFLGGSGDDEGFGMAIDASGNAYVTGFSSSTNFPIQNAFQPWNAGGYEAFVTQINPAGSAWVFSTYLGGFGTDASYGIFYAPSSDSLYLTGQTYSSTSMPLVDPYQAIHGGSSDVVVARLDLGPESADLSITKTDSPDPVLVGKNLSYHITAVNGGPDTASGVRILDRLPSQVTFISATPSQGSGCTLSPLGYEVSCEMGDLSSGGNVTVTLTVNVPTWVLGTITNTASVMANQSDPDVADNVATQDTTVILYRVILPVLRR